MISVCGILPAQAAKAPLERLQVTDAYLELRTGPGRGYPIFFVAARHQLVEVLLRHTDWFKVRAESGEEGWVVREQLASTLTESGAKKSFHDIELDDYLNRKLELGTAFGRFKAEPMLKAWKTYRLSDTLSVEGAAGQVQGVYSGTDFWHLGLLSQPWSDRRLSPFFSIGFGNFRNIPNASLVGASTTNAKLSNAAVGVRYHLSNRFVMRADYSFYTAFTSDRSTVQYRAITLGLSFSF